MSFPPEHCTTLVEEGFEIQHCCYGVEEEAEEMRERDVGDAIR